ncbi:MAG: hypothetical protein ACPLTR_04155 [Thermacetogeniaceae bacterium]
MFLIAVAVFYFCAVSAVIYRVSTQNKYFKENWKKARVVLVTKRGLPVRYHGHAVLYEEARSSENFIIVLDVDGRKITLDPGEKLKLFSSDERGWGFKSWRDDDELSRYAFYLPDGEKLRLKAVSRDLSELYWARGE